MDGFPKILPVIPHSVLASTTVLLYMTKRVSMGLNGSILKSLPTWLFVTYGGIWSVCIEKLRVILRISCVSVMSILNKRLQCAYRIEQCVMMLPG